MRFRAQNIRIDSGSRFLPFSFALLVDCPIAQVDSRVYPPGGKQPSAELTLCLSVRSSRSDGAACTSFIRAVASLERIFPFFELGGYAPEINNPQSSSTYSRKTIKLGQLFSCC